MCTLLRQHYENKQEVRVCYLGDLVKLDESCCEVLEFVKLSMDTGILYRVYFSIFLLGGPIGSVRNEGGPLKQPSGILYSPLLLLFLYAWPKFNM